MAEKRDNTRTRKRLMVRFGEGRTNRTGFSKNLSITGINIKTNNVFAPGTTLQLELAFPARRVSLWGRVIWAKKVPASLAHVIECGMGIHFLEPPEEWEAFFREWEGPGK